MCRCKRNELWIYYITQATTLIHVHADQQQLLELTKLRYMYMYVWWWRSPWFLLRLSINTTRQLLTQVWQRAVHLASHLMPPILRQSVSLFSHLSAPPLLPSPPSILSLSPYYKHAHVHVLTTHVLMTWPGSMNDSLINLHRNIRGSRWCTTALLWHTPHQILWHWLGGALWHMGGVLWWHLGVRCQDAGDRGGLWGWDWGRIVLLCELCEGCLGESGGRKGSRHFRDSCRYMYASVYTS